MKTNKFSLAAMAVAAVLTVGCGTMSKTGKGTLIGTGAGAALGAGVGYLLGGTKGMAIGAAAGGGVGAGAGALIGKKMDKQAAELAKIQGAQVESVTDANGLQAIKVTFESGILFPTGSSTLSAASKASLDKFAASLKETAETDVTIYGHTDNTGSLATNQKLSLKRAEAVSNYLTSKGVDSARMLSVKGLDLQQPVASNDTEAGRAQNRRVEIYISANQNMISEANNGTLK